ncbi:MAG: alpha/beta hydrolase [Pseudomonadota bacterium]
MPRDASVIPFPPPNLQLREGALSRGGVDVRWALTRPAAEHGPPVLLLNGRTECVEKYAEVVAELGARGRPAATLDWRGQGRSGREGRPGVGHVRRYQDYLDDLDALLAGPFADLPRPFDVIAHSMGGHLALRWTLANDQQVRTLALSAPMLDLRFQGLTRKLGRLGLAAACLLGLGKATAFKHAHTASDAAAAAWFPTNPLTYDRPRFDAWTGFLVDHPDLRLDAGDFAWLRATFRSIDALKRALPDRFPVPTLFCVGDEERVVSAAAIRAAADRPNGRLLALERCRHEPLIEDIAVRAAFWAAWDALAADG